MNNDRGGEYEAMDSFCKESGIRDLYTMPYKPQQNGIVERRNITLMDMTRFVWHMLNYPTIFGVKLYPLQHIFLIELRLKQNLLHLMNIG